MPSLPWIDATLTTAARKCTGRFGPPEEFGKACAFLCSADAGFIIGQNLVIDGGSVNVTM
jgi:3-oxoacyl-[acyl-carrier protein] reductase